MKLCIKEPLWNSSMPTKTKTNYSENSKGASTKDSFQTPRYAVEILDGIIPSGVITIWEPAAGEGQISGVLREMGYRVRETEINGNHSYLDFLLEDEDFEYDAIVSNPPFSVKKKFIHKCLEKEKPFAMLIPADWSGWLIDAVFNRGCQILMPTRRIDFITPNIVQRVNEGEQASYTHFREIPENLHYEYSSSDFHSMWLTWGFGFPERVNSVELSIDMKKRIL